MNECVKNHCPDLPYGVHSVSHCTVCHETFASHKIADRHRVGEFEPDSRRCLSTTEMYAKGWELNPKGRWVGGTKMSPETLANLKAHQDS